MTPAIFAQNITKSFGKYSILEDLSLHIDQGTVFGLVGLNGAGKTTLIRALLGILRIDKGSISILEQEPWRHRENLYRRLGVVLEHDGFWGNLTFAENMKIYAAAKGIAFQELDSYIKEFWSHTELPATGKKVKYFSRGQRVQCGLCRAFLGWPRACFLDEPAVALDVGAYDHFRTMVETARVRGAAILISSHQLETIDDLCTRVGVLRDKQLSELDTLHDDNNKWALLSSDNPRIAELIIGAGGKDIARENGLWKFTIEDSGRTIPALVKMVVHEGFDVKEICPLRFEFSDSIRKVYLSEGGRETG